MQVAIADNFTESNILACSSSVLRINVWEVTPMQRARCLLYFYSTFVGPTALLSVKAPSSPRPLAFWVCCHHCTCLCTVVNSAHTFSISFSLPVISLWHLPHCNKTVRLVVVWRGQILAILRFIFCQQYFSIVILWILTWGLQWTLTVSVGYKIFFHHMSCHLSRPLCNENQVTATSSN